MSGEHAGSEKAGVGIITQQIVADRVAYDERDDKGVEAKKKALVLVLNELTQIQFQAHDEHDIKKTDGGKHLHAAMGVVDPVETVGTDQHTGNDQSNDTGHIDPFEQDGCQQNNRQ